MENGLEKIAAILRVGKREMDSLQSDLERITGKVGIIHRVAEENEVLIRKSLDFLGLGRNVTALEIYDALISKIEADDSRIFNALGCPNLGQPEELEKILDITRRISNNRRGFFLKTSVAEKLLQAEPPRKILKALGYKNVDEMLAKEDLFEVFSALRFLEDQEWLNDIFFKQYDKLTPADFEEREITVRALDIKWKQAAEKFVEKKYHNTSHLKELGVIFVIPISLGVSGETLRLISLLAHYCHEIYFYSDLFRNFSANENSFAKNLILLLKGEGVIERKPEVLQETRRPKFLVIQRYLAKDDENDWRLFVPHVNPEAEHWRRAEEAIVKLDKILPAIKDGLDFWNGLGWVGDYFKDDVGKDVLVSFNIVDTAMALVKEKEMIKYLYHHQEALWNKIYLAYFGEEEMMKKVRDNIVRGWFEV